MRRAITPLLWAAILLCGVALGLTIRFAPVFAQAKCQTFSATGHSLCGRFLQYWQQHGGLAQQGYPVSEPFSEMSDIDGKLYTVQYFERAAFEMHPENRSPNDVLLSLLGRFQYEGKYPSGAPKQVPNTIVGSQFFAQTGKRLGGSFLSYWQSHGGLAQQGYPISDEFLETSVTDGKVYKVQYFERIVFEAHPEKSTPYDVLLSLLGTFRLRAKYGDSSSLPSAPPALPSGGLGLSRAAWEKIHGTRHQPPIIQDTAEVYYEGDKYQVGYGADGPDGLIVALFVSFPPSMSMAEVRAETRTLLPTDAQPLVLNQTDGAGYGGSYDRYLSQWLSTVYPPGTLFWGEPPADVWVGTRPGTFTVSYSGSGDSNHGPSVSILTGNGYPYP